MTEPKTKILENDFQVPNTRAGQRFIRELRMYKGNRYSRVQALPRGRQKNGSNIMGPAKYFGIYLRETPAARDEKWQADQRWREWIVEQEEEKAEDKYHLEKAALKNDFSIERDEWRTQREGMLGDISRDSYEYSVKMNATERRLRIVSLLGGLLAVLSTGLCGLTLYLCWLIAKGS